MKILQVIPYFNPEFGGDVNICYNISKELARRGFDVTIITTDFNYNQIYADSIKEVSIISIKSSINILFFLYSPKMKKWLRKNLKNFDLVHLHTYRSYQNSLILKYCKSFNIPFILQAHGSIPYNGKKFLKKTYDKFYGINLLKSASKCIALNETEKNQFQQMGIKKENIEIIPNGIDLSKYKNLPERGIFRRKYGINDDIKIFLYLGRLNKIKGLDLLVDAFSDVTKIKNNVRLVIVGSDDGYLTILKRQIDNLSLNEKVLLTGPLYDNDKLCAYIDSDVYILPSRYEMFPITVLEAFATNCPVILSEKCVIASEIKNKMAGSVTLYKPVELKNEIIKMVDNKYFRNECIKNAKNLLYNQFSLDIVVDKLELIYKNIEEQIK